MIYVAGPFFNPKERMHLNEMIEWIKREYPNEELFIPMEHFIQNGANLPNVEWDIIDRMIRTVFNDTNITIQYWKYEK